MKKELLKEERKRRRINSPHFRRQRLWVLLGLLLVGGLATLYLTNRERIYTYQFRQAEELVREGSYVQAAERLQALAKDHPEFVLAPDAILLAGEVLDLHLNQHQDGLLLYLLLVRDYPHGQPAMVAQRRAAMVYKQWLRDYPSALTLLQRLVDAGSQDADRMRYEVADCYFQLHNYEQARIELETLLKNHPESPLLPEVQYRIGISYLLDGQFDPALAAFQEVVTRWPEDSFALEAQMSMAGVLEQRDELRQALKLLEGLRERYSTPELLERKIDQVKQRMDKKKRAI